MSKSPIKRLERLLNIVMIMLEDKLVAEGHKMSIEEMTQIHVKIQGLVNDMLAILAKAKMLDGDIEEIGDFLPPPKDSQADTSLGEIKNEEFIEG